MGKIEIGTKHYCMLRYFDDEDQILASGELIKNGRQITYSCMSSLFMDLMAFLWKKNRITGKEEKNEFQKDYEMNVVKKLLKKYFKRYKIDYIENIEYIKNIEYVKNIEFGKREEFDVRQLCKKKNPPKCLRYMKKGDCQIQIDNPEGPDCNAGLDFCSNLDVEDPPQVIIPESKYVYQEKLDMKKVKEYYESQGKTKLMPIYLKMYLSQDGLSEDPRFMKRELIWPILE